MYSGLRFPLLTGLLAALALTGCSRDGTILIKNDTGTELTGELDSRGFALSGFESIELSVKIGTQVLIFGPDTKDVRLTGESCTRFPFEQMVTVQSGDTRQVSVQPDAVCVRIQNQGEFEVLEVYQRDHGETDWGENLLDGSLYTTEGFERRLMPGAYDFLMIDSCGDSTEVSDGQELTRGTIRWVTHVSGQDGCVVP